MKLIEKQRDGARVKSATIGLKLLTSASSPWLSHQAEEGVNRELYRKLDPVTLLKELEQRQDHFWTFANGQRELEGNDSPREMDAVVRKYLVEITASQEPNGIRRYRRTKKPRTWRTRKDPLLKSGQRFVSNWKPIPLKQPKRSSLGFSNAIPVDFRWATADAAATSEGLA